MANEDVWKAFLSGFVMNEFSPWKGETPAEPKLSANREMGR